MSASLTPLELRAFELLNLCLESEFGLEIEVKVAPNYAKSIFFKVRKLNPNFAHIAIENSRDKPSNAIWIYQTEKEQSN